MYPLKLLVPINADLKAHHSIFKNTPAFRDGITQPAQPLKHTEYVDVEDLNDKSLPTTTDERERTSRSDQWQQLGADAMWKMVDALTAQSAPRKFIVHDLTPDVGDLALAVLVNGPSTMFYVGFGDDNTHVEWVRWCVTSRAVELLRAGQQEVDGFRIPPADMPCPFSGFGIRQNLN